MFQIEAQECSYEPGFCSNIIMKESGDVWELKEFHEHAYHYGYKREKSPMRKLGRSSESGDRDGNRRRVAWRRKRMVMDLVNCNEWKLKVWHTIAYARNMKGLSQAHLDRKNYFRRLERFIQTGSLFGRRVSGFVPRPKFALEVVGVVDFQDGKRRKDKIGRGAIHFHMVLNIPYIPQVQVIVSDVRDIVTGKEKQGYLQDDGSWSLVAGKHTLWFSSSREVENYLKCNKEWLVDDFHLKVRKKPLCVCALLWGRGFIDIKSIDGMRRAGYAANVGEYMVSRYMADDVSDSRLDGRKAYFFSGDLERPTFYREHIVVDAIMTQLGMWRFLVYEKELMVEYLGAMSIFVFNFCMMCYEFTRFKNKKVLGRSRWKRCDALASSGEP